MEMTLTWCSGCAERDRHRRAVAFARAAGETAPLLVTVLGNNNLTYDILRPMQALPLLAYRYTEQP